MGLIPGQITHGSWPKNQNMNNRSKNCNKFNKDLFLKMVHIKKKKKHHQKKMKPGNTYSVKKVSLQSSPNICFQRLNMQSSATY